MLSADGLIDGSYDISVLVTDTNVEKTIRVRGDVHIGGLMLRIVNSLDAGPLDWSDHAVWWPTKNIWLLRTRRTLDQYDVPAGAVLYFTPMHRYIRVNFPDLQIIPVRVNFSANVFKNVISVCKTYAIRHPEELSFLRSSVARHSESKPSTKRKSRPISRSVNPAMAFDSSASGDRAETASIDSASADIMLSQSTANLFDANDSDPTTSSGFGSTDQLAAPTTSRTHPVAVGEALNRHVCYRPQTFLDKAKLNSRWLTSSLSLMEQGILEDDIIYLRYKYSTFFDLLPKYDEARINLIYEQARWSLVSECVHCTDEEMIFFAALQLHIKEQALKDDETGVDSYSPRDVIVDEPNDDGDDDINDALNNLQMSLEGKSNEIKATEVTQYPELKDHHMFLKSKKTVLNRYKRRYCVFKDTQLSVFEEEDQESSGAPPLASFDLQGCFVRGETDVARDKFLIKATSLPTSSESSVDISLRQDNMEMHAKWLVAFQTASKRRTMANATFNSEFENVLKFLQLRKLNAEVDVSGLEITTDDLNNFVSGRVLRQTKRQQIMRRMLEIAANLERMSLVEAKLTFIEAWQNLPDAGHSYFIVTFRGRSNKKELIAVGVDRLLHLDLKTGRCLRAWPYDKMKAWAVNWNTEQLKIELEGHKDSEIAFNCINANCHVVHEYIGGHVFLAMRSRDKNQTLDEKLFHKFTGGRS